MAADQIPFYFHNHQELVLSIAPFQLGNVQVPQVNASPNSASARAFGYVTSDSPSSGATSVALSSQLYVSGSQSGYAAVVAWVTNPFPANVKVDGDVVMHVWMSSNDGLGFLQGSQYFMGVADYTPISSHLLVLSPFVSSSVLGNILSPSPQEYTSTLHISDHEFQAGNMLMFFAGAASNKQGWQFQVYFDGKDTPSGAEVPSALLSNASTTVQQSTTIQQTTAAPGCPISVSLTANSTSGSAPLTVTFYTTVTGANGAIQYDWWFGDGSHITGNPTMTYTYQNPWNYSVFVRVLDFKGCWSQTNVIVSVTPNIVPEFPSGTLLVVMASVFAVLSILSFNRSNYRSRRNSVISQSGYWKTSGPILRLANKN